MEVKRGRQPLILILPQQAKEHQIMVGSEGCHHTGANGERRWERIQRRADLKLCIGVYFPQRLFPFLILFVQTGITELKVDQVSFTWHLPYLNINQCREDKGKEGNNGEKRYHCGTMSNLHTVCGKVTFTLNGARSSSNVWYPHLNGSGNWGLSTSVVIA